MIPSGLLTSTFQVFVKGMRGRVMTFQMHRSESVLSLKLRIQESEEPLPVDNQRLIFAGKQLEDSKTMGDYCISDQSTVHLVCRLTGDIGTFGDHAGTEGLAYLTDALQLKSATPEDCRRLLDCFGERKSSSPVVGTTCLLGKEACEALVCEAEKRYMASAYNQGGGCDFVTDLTWKELASIAGDVVVPWDEFGSSIPRSAVRICLRRTFSTGKCIQFHLDRADRTMQVFLNAEDEYEGGRTVFATHDRGFVVPRRTQGHYTIHSWNMVHGVTAMSQGVRYALFFLHVGDSSA